MEFIYWKNSVGKSPPLEDMMKLSNADRISGVRLLKGLEMIGKYSFEQLCIAGRIEKIKNKGHSKIKLYELRLPLHKIQARLLLIRVLNKTYVVHFIIKKAKKLDRQDIELAIQRGLLINNN